MSTPDKIATAIGLILGGVGGGMTHQPNQVLGFLNNQINRDLEGQKADMANKQNLLGALRQQYGDQIAADNMYVAFRKNILAHQLEAAGANTQSQLAKSAALTASGQLKQQVLPLVQKAAILQQLSGNGPGSSGGGLDPARQIMLQEKAGLIDEPTATAARKELDKAQSIEQLRSALKDSYDDLNSKFLAGSLSPRDRQSAVTAFSGPLSKLLENRFNLTESQQQIDAILPKAFESTQTRQNKYGRIDTLLNIERGTPTLDGLPVPVRVPQLPRKSQVVHVNGVPYARPR